MLALKEFANLITLHIANLAATYARLLAESNPYYAGLPSNNRTSSGRKLLKAVSQACSQQDSAPLIQIFKDNSQRWPQNINSPWPMAEVECLGQTLFPVVTNLEAGKFLWQLLFEARHVVQGNDISVSAAGTLTPQSSDKEEPAPSTLDADYEQAQAELLKFKLGIERSGDAIFLTNIDGTITYVNPAFEKIYGFKQTEAVGQTPRILKSGVIPQETYQHFWQALLNKEIVGGDIINKTKDGQLKNIEGSNNPILDNAGNIVGFLSIHRDVSSRKQSDEKLNKLATELETVAQVSTSISTILDADELLQTVVDSTKEQFALYHAHIYLLNDAGDTLELVAGAGKIGRQMLKQGWSIPLQKEMSLVARSARSRQVIVVNNVFESTGFFPNPLLPKTSSEMAVPIIIGERVLGVLDVQSAVVDYFSREDERIQTALAAQVAVALQNAELYQKAQNSLAQTEALYQAGTDLSTAQSFNDILDALRKYTVLGQDAQTVSLGFFDHAWTTENEPEGVNIVARWNQAEQASFRSRYQIREFPSTDVMLRPDELVIIENMATDPRLDDYTRSVYLDTFKAKGTLFAPLRAGGEWVGYVTANYNQPTNFSEDDKRRLNSLIGQAAVVAQAIRQLQEAENRVRREQTIREITEKMRAATSLQDLVKTTTEELGQRFSAEYASIKFGLKKPTAAEPMPANNKSSNGKQL